MVYTLVVSGERFSFTQEQLESDPDNYFTSCFGSSWGMKELVIEKEPALFKLIQAHLRGYEIFPIPEAYVPYMSNEAVLGNLLKEAEFYVLGNLVKKIKDFQAMNNPNPTRPKYKFRTVRISFDPLKILNLTEIVPTRWIMEVQRHTIGT